MEFDRKGPEGGLEMYSTIENGKALLECKVYLQKTLAEEMAEESENTFSQRRNTSVDIRMWDREERLVFYCNYPLGQEELAKGIILHPHLWQGMEDPYRYRVRVALMEQKHCVTDMIETFFAFRTFRRSPQKGWLLNQKPFSVRAVVYELPVGAVVPASSMEEWNRCIRRDLELIKQMGANTLCLIGEPDRRFCELCDEIGLLIWWRDAADFDKQDSADIPRFYGTEDSLLTLRGRFLTDRYYFYKACWSKEPFVHISTESLAYQENGTIKVAVYSNQNKAALYVNGVLYEFKTEGPEFLFEEIPVTGMPLMLTAETGECSTSVTVYRVHRM